MFPRSRMARMLVAMTCAYVLSAGAMPALSLDGGTLPEGLRDSSKAADQAGESVRGGNTEALNAGTWYLRSFDLSEFAGRSFTNVKFFSREINTKTDGTYEAHVRDIRIVDSSRKTLIDLQPVATSGFPADTMNMNVSAARSAGSPRPRGSAMLMANTRLVTEHPWGVDGFTPTPRALPADLREINVTFPVNVAGVASLNSAEYLRFDRPQIIPSDAFLDYDIRIDTGSISCSGGFDLESVPRTWLSLRDVPRMADLTGAPLHPANQLPQAVGIWLHRRFSLASVAGKPFQLALLSAEFTPKTTGTYRASYRNIRIVDAQDRVYWDFYPKLGDLGASVPMDTNTPGWLTAQDLVGVTLTPDAYVIAAGTRAKLNVAIHNFDAGASHTVEFASVNLDGGQAPLVLASKINAVLKPSETKTFDLDIPGNVPPGNYKAVADINVQGQTGSAYSFAIAVAAHPAPLPGPNEYIAKGNFAWGADIDAATSSACFAELRQNGGNFVNLFVSWGHIETEPGKYDFAVVDRAIAAARRAHLRIEITFWTTEREFPEWVRSEVMLDKDQKAGQRLSLSYYAPTGRQAYMKLIRTIVERYKANDDVVGYQFAALGWGDGFFATPNHGSSTPNIYDYSSWSQTAFQHYVRDILQLTLAQASQRYELTLGSWDDLKEPVYQQGIDVRPLWWDFQNFRCWTVENMWDEICRNIRSCDSRKKIELMYGGNLEATGLIGNDYDAGARIARKYQASIHNTCYEGYSVAPLLGTYTREWGITHTCETAGTPCEIPAHQQGMFNVLKYGSKGYCWVGGRPIGYYPSFARLSPVACELSDAVPTGKKVGVIESVSAYQCDLQPVDLRGTIASTFQFVHNASLPADLYSDRSFMLDGHHLDPHETPVIMDCAAPVLTAQAADTLATYVQAGGALIAHASSGKFTPGNSSERYRLLTKLGYPSASDLPSGAGRAIASGEEMLAGQSVSLRNIAPLTSLPPGARVLARFSGGQTALASWNCGKGRVFVLGGTPDYDDASTRKSILALLASAGVRPVSTATNGVITATLVREGTRFIALDNPSPDSITTTVTDTGLTGPIRAYDLLERRALSVKSGSDWKRGVDISLQPYEVTALAIDSSAASPRSFPPLNYPLPGAQAGGEAKIPSDGFGEYRPVMAWEIVGAFENPGGFNGASFYQNRPPEQEWDASATYAESGQTLRWRRVDTPHGELRLTDYYPYSDKHLAYAMTDLVAAKECTVRLKCGVDYGLFLWLNGQPLFDSNAVPQRGAPTQGEFTIEVPLRAGHNRLAARVAPGSMGWAMWMQIAAQNNVVVTTQAP